MLNLRIFGSRCSDFKDFQFARRKNRTFRPMLKLLMLQKLGVYSVARMNGIDTQFTFDQSRIIG